MIVQWITYVALNSSGTSCTPCGPDQQQVGHLHRHLKELYGNPVSLCELCQQWRELPGKFEESPQIASNIIQHPNWHSLEQSAQKHAREAYLKIHRKVMFNFRKGDINHLTYSKNTSMLHRSL